MKKRDIVYAPGDHVRVVDGEDHPGCVGTVKKVQQPFSTPLQAVLVDLLGVGEKWLYAYDLAPTTVVELLGGLESA